mmetsp:Transcript_9370/g.15148  ORF Transcript_9370/g.15148 Transcript_9370/m.15148 type:complete len:216 (-) Transcript_9370:468-1115(-)
MSLILLPPHKSFCVRLVSFPSIASANILLYLSRSWRRTPPLSFFGTGVPSVLSFASFSASCCVILADIEGSTFLICCTRMLLSCCVRNPVPSLCEIEAYALCDRKNFVSSAMACLTVFPLSISSWLRLTMPTYPCRRDITFPLSIFHAFVPLSIRSILVRIPSVLCPSGSICRASFNDSELAMSVFAGLTATIIEFLFDMYCTAISLIRLSISSG